jgi:hypothetical protein
VDASAGLTAAAMAGLVLFLANGRRISQFAHRVIGVALPVALLVVLALIVLVLVLLLVRVWFTRRGLGRRVGVVVLAPDSFEPGLDEVLRFAGQLSRVHRAVGGWFDQSASAVRILLDRDADGRMRYSLCVPERSLPAVRSALSVYDRVEIRRALPTPREVGREGVWVARTELRLARPGHEPLAELALDPDPLHGFARVIEDLHPRLGESAEVAVDLLPLPAGGRRRIRRRLLRGAHRDTRHANVNGALLPNQGGHGGARRSAGELVGARSEREQITAKLGHAEPLFQTQILLRCSSRSEARAKGHMQALLACFDAHAGANSFRAVGVRVLGLWFLGSDLPVLRRWFDRRMASGLFRPLRESVVSAREIAGFLKPPTVHCHSQNIVRLGPAVDPPPRTLPVFRGQPNVLPLGRVSSEHGERMVGVGLEDTIFCYLAGRSRYGKTELALAQFLHIVRSGHGGMFIDPHQDAIQRLKSCLTEPEYAQRVIELDLTGARAYEGQPGWNLFAARGLTVESRERRVEAIVDSFASALGWSERNNRALTITTQATAALIELAAILPTQLAPTVFQLSTILSDDGWRETVMPFLSAPRRQFFGERFPRLSSDAITPVTNLVDRLRSSTPLAALLGANANTYDITRAMNDGRIVLACPGAAGAKDRLVANLLVFDVLHSATGRAHVPPERRRAFYLFCDEIQTFDSAAGNLAGVLEQSAKYGIRGVFANQNPERLTPQTLNALTTNRSHIITTALNAHAAALIAREWGSQPGPDAITHLPRRTFLTQVTHHGELSQPFLIRTVSVPELYPEAYQPDHIAAAQPLIDEASSRVDAAKTITALDTLDTRIQNHLTHVMAGNPTGGHTSSQDDAARSTLPRLPDPHEPDA